MKCSTRSVPTDNTSAWPIYRCSTSLRRRSRARFSACRRTSSSPYPIWKQNPVETAYLGTSSLKNYFTRHTFRTKWKVLYHQTVHRRYYNKLLLKLTGKSLLSRCEDSRQYVGRVSPPRSSDEEHQVRT